MLRKGTENIYLAVVNEKVVETAARVDASRPREHILSEGASWTICNTGKKKGSISGWLRAKGEKKGRWVIVAEMEIN